MKSMRTTTRQNAGAFALVCLLLQAFIPVGYMPAAVSSGSWVTLCPDGVSSVVVGLLEHAHGGHDHHQHHEIGESPFAQCDLASPIGSAVATEDLPVSVNRIRTEFALWPVLAAPTQRAYRKQNPRSPPVH